MEFNQHFYQYSAAADEERKNKEKYEDFKNRILKFADIKTLAEAQALAKEVMPTANEINRFDIGSAKCIVINKPDCFRISLDSTEEFICYDFVPENEGEEKSE